MEGRKIQIVVMLSDLNINYKYSYL